MKIYGIDPKTVAPSTTKTEKSSSVDFQALLRGQLESLNKPGETAPVEKIDSIDNVPPALRIEGLALTEASINTLEAFSLALGNNSLDYSSLAPFVDTLEEETSALIAVRHQLPDDDPLSAILDQVATQTYLETAKFRRGDYAA